MLYGNSYGHYLSIVIQIVDAITAKCLRYQWNIGKNFLLFFFSQIYY